ncbi:MAG: hypothetical protein IJ864_00260 [Alphaproteobacteria bacterium]|nr:hypothetical protein [Alphaproteobacteria bacterium]
MDYVLEPEMQAVSDNLVKPENIKEQDDYSPQSYWGNLSDDDEDYLNKKGVKSPTDLLHSYRELERAYSSRVALPRDGDKEALRKFYSKLGMPNDCKTYEVDLAEEDLAFGDAFKQTCLENNILPQSAQALYDWYVKNRAEQEADVEQQQYEQSQAEMNEQLREWGNTATQNTELMKRGIRLFVGDSDEDGDDTIARMEEALGTKRMMKLFCRLGNAVGEDNSVSFKCNAQGNDAFDSVAFFREMFRNAS